MTIIVRTVKASAPGKAVVSGEYAVLGGAPAISMALNRRAYVTVRPGEGHHHTLASPGYVAGRMRFRSTVAGSIEWIDTLPSADTFRLFECVWRRAAVEPDTALAITLETREFFDSVSGSKLGIGSSSGLAVALSAAFETMSGAKDSAYPLAADAHRAFQDGSGSGIDIASAYHGGLIRFQTKRRYDSLAWPDGLEYRFLWSGQAARTKDKLGNLDTRSTTRSTEAFVAASDAVASAFVAGSKEGVLTELRAYVGALEAYDLDRELGIFEAGHRQLTGIARSRADLVYKPCGAGGGDIGVAIAETNESLEEFAMIAKEHNFIPLDVSLEREGVLIEV